MKVTTINCQPLLGLFIALLVCLSIPETVFGQTEKLGIVNYTPPKGWNKTQKENVVVFHEINEAAARFCFITIYGATSSVGNPQKDFTKEWNNRVVTPFQAEANPETETESADGWTAISGGAAIDFQDNKAIAYLTVISGFGKTVSVLGIFNNEAYLTQLSAFRSSIEMDKAATVAPQAVAAAPRTEGGRLVIPMPTRQLTIDDLAGQWGENAGITTTYVNRYTGAYAGFESLHFSDKMTITKEGEYFSDFFALQNGRKIKEKTSGTVAVSGRVIVIKQTNTAKYVVRGWLELPEMTILTVCGPWYNDDVIPPEIFNNPDQGANLNKNWVRKK